MIASASRHLRTVSLPHLDSLNGERGDDRRGGSEGAVPAWTRRFVFLRTSAEGIRLIVQRPDASQNLVHNLVRQGLHEHGGTLVEVDRP